MLEEGRAPVNIDYFATLLIATTITIVLVPIVKGMALRLNAVDLPDERKVHSLPMPRSGGVSMAVGMLVPVVLWLEKDPFVASVMAGACVLVLFGLVDDVRHLGSGEKLVGQVLAATLIIFWGGLRIRHMGLLAPEGYLLPVWAAVPLTCLVIVGVTNAINLADGLDGLAGGISLLIFLCLGFVGHLCGFSQVALMSAAVCGACIGFLRFNTHPATIFMGDAGSQLLGFLAVVLSLKLSQGSTPLSPLFPLLLLGFPILDTLAVMAERVSRGRPLFAADKNHFHHKLMGLGLRHSEAVLVIYAIQSALVSSAFVLRFHSDRLLLVLYLAFSGLVLAGFHLAGKARFTFSRDGILDLKWQQWLRQRINREAAARFWGRAMEIAVPLVFFAVCLVAWDIPGYFAGLCLGGGLMLLGVWCIAGSHLDWVARVVIYIAIPVLVYLTETSPAPWANGSVMALFNAAFGMLILIAILTLNYTRRRQGFKSNPMDFIILFLALGVPNLPDFSIQKFHIGMLIAKVVVLYFSFDVLLGELRGKIGPLMWATSISLFLVSLKTFFLTG